MTIQEMRSVFEKLNTCQEWSLQLLKFGKVRNEFSYNTHNVTITTQNALTEFMESLADIYIGRNGKMDSFQEVVDYDGSTIGSRIHRIELTNPLVSESYGKLATAMDSPDMAGNALEFSASAYVLKGSIEEGDGAVSDIRLFTIINPFKTLKHTFSWDGDSFKVIPTKTLALRQHFDVMIWGDAVYMFSLSGEKLFDMERAYRQVCANKVEEIVCTGILSDDETFRQYASSGYNPRRFVAFDSNRLQKIKNDIVFRNKMAEKFGIIQGDNETYDSSDKDNVERIVKFLCKKGMLDPIDENPVEVEGSKQWR